MLAVSKLFLAINLSHHTRLGSGGCVLPTFSSIISLEWQSSVDCLKVSKTFIQPPQTVESAALDASKGAVFKTLQSTWSGDGGGCKFVVWVWFGADWYLACITSRTSPSVVSQIINYAYSIP